MKEEQEKLAKSLSDSSGEAMKTLQEEFKTHKEQAEQNESDLKKQLQEEQNALKALQVGDGQSCAHVHCEQTQGTL